MTKCQGAIDEAARQEFTAEVRIALTFARDGWRTVPPASPTT
ncbi:hypothetical protein [Ornithinimicrobium sp. INDO-MA30-4]|nr:hypothetical protein [Ornithinimicrobium sp. INDO-MA30-4]